MIDPRTVTSAVKAFARRFLTRRAGNVAIITCLAMTSLVFLVGAGVDYTLSRRRQDLLNGIADAAALAGVTPAMMVQTDANAVAAATTMFSSQSASVTNVSGLSYSVTHTDTTTATGVTRTITVSYTGNSSNIFSGILGVASLPIQGASSATSSVAPNIDFYLLLDTSSSMEIPSTSAGIAAMMAATASTQDKPNGCAFACHESDPAGDGLTVDNYSLFRALQVANPTAGYALRIDLVQAATANLMTSATNTAAQNNVQYRTAIYTMDTAINQIYPTRSSPSTPAAPSSNLSAAATAVTSLLPVEYYKNNWLTSTDQTSDEDSFLDQVGLSGINTAMPNPGNGTNATGDTPQEVLMIVSDGVTDESYNGNRVYFPIDDNPSATPNSSYCAAIKNRGIRIAFLYLTYNPMTSDSWYNTYIAPFQSQIAGAAQNCASSGLFFQVNTDGDISAAMNTLFQKAIATARLTQ